MTRGSVTEPLVSRSPLPERDRVLDPSICPQGIDPAFEPKFGVGSYVTVEYLSVVAYRFNRRNHEAVLDTEFVRDRRRVSGFRVLYRRAEQRCHLAIRRTVHHLLNVPTGYAQLLRKDKSVDDCIE